MTRPRLILELLLKLFFPSAAFLVISSWLNVQLLSLRAPIVLNWQISKRLLFLKASPAELLQYSAAFSGAVAVLILLPERFKKKWICGLVLGYLFCWVDPLAVSLFLLGTVAAWYGVNRLGFRKFLAFSAMLLGLFLTACIFLIPSKQGMEWQLAAGFGLGLYSAACYARERKGGLGFEDCLIYWSSLPGGFLAIIYGFGTLTHSFLSERHEKLISRGSARLFLGVGTLLLLSIAHVLVFPKATMATWSLFQMSADDSLGGPFEAVFWAVWFFATFILGQAASVQALQGVAILLGYNVKDQTDLPLFSRSFLDFWRRDGLNTRDFFLQHFFIPSYVRYRSLYLSSMLTWLVWSVAFCFVFAPIVYVRDLGLHVLSVNNVIRTVIKMTLIYGHVAYLELKLTPIVRASAGPYLKRVYAVAMWLVFFAALVIGRELSATPSFGES